MAEIEPTETENVEFASLLPNLTVRVSGIKIVKQNWVSTYSSIIYLISVH